MVLSRVTCTDLNFNRASQATVLKIYYRAARAESGGPGKKFSFLVRQEMMVCHGGLRWKQRRENSGWILGIY